MRLAPTDAAAMSRARRNGQKHPLTLAANADNLRLS